LIREKYRGIRPAAGYPACPDHTEKGTLWQVLDAEKQTASNSPRATPCGPRVPSAACTLRIPRRNIFGVGKIDRDQVLDYHLRKGMDLQNRRTLLAPNLNTIRTRNSSASHQRSPGGLFMRCFAVS